MLIYYYEQINTEVVITVRTLMVQTVTLISTAPLRHPTSNSTSCSVWNRSLAILIPNKRGTSAPLYYCILLFTLLLLSCAHIILCMDHINEPIPIHGIFIAIYLTSILCYMIPVIKNIIALNYKNKKF